MAKNYTTQTASLKATIADVRNLDAKKLTLNGKNILDYISESGFDSYDTRDPQLKNDELDIWNTKISLSDNGHIEVKPHVHSIENREWDDSKNEYVYTFEGITENQLNTLLQAVKVIDNEVLGENDEHIMFWQTDGLTEGEEMFYNINLTSFNSDLSSLTNGKQMFNYCLNLSEFSSDLSSLTNGDCMFEGCYNLTTFDSDSSNLTNSHQMFNGCYNLKSFNCELSNLTNGSGMFYCCGNLTSFTSNLSSLTDGLQMFFGNGSYDSCKLDAQSVANIVHSLPQRDTKPTNFFDGGIIDIGIGCNNTEADRLLFAQECDCETWQELLDDFSAKNWQVRFQYNGRPTTTYNMRRGETLPIYAKLEEVTDNKKIRFAKYISADGSKFYNISYFHSTNGSTEGYDVFSSLEEAISTYNVTPKN